MKPFQPSKKTTALALGVALFAQTFAHAGIVDGGGGNIPASAAATIAEVQKAVKHSEVVLRMYANALQARYSPATATEAQKKILGGSRTLFDAVSSTPIEVRDSGPCYDADHHEMDGSIYASTPGAICISAYRIAPKLVPEQVQVQTFALIVHELSHTLGTNEDEAVELQHQAIADLKNDEAIHKAVYQLNIMEAAISAAARDAQTNTNVSNFCHIDRPVSLAYLDRNLGDHSFAVLPPKDADAFWLQATRISLVMNNYLLGKCEGGQVLGWENDALDTDFGRPDKDSATFGKIKVQLELGGFNFGFVDLNPDQPNRYDDFVIHRVRTDDQMAQEYSIYQNYIKALNKYLYKLGVSAPLTVLPTP